MFPVDGLFGRLAEADRRQSFRLFGRHKSVFPTLQDCRYQGTHPMMSLSPIRSSLLPRTILPSIRSYHSSNHPRSPSYTPIQHKILSTALSLVPSTGFTPQTLTDGAKQAGYLEITHNLFPRGPWSLIEYHLVRQRESLSSILLPEGAGVGKTIRTLCVERLKGNKDVIGRWQEVRVPFGWGVG
jgi:ubiquinone biosynthesis protein COQ9